jgi:tetratricopeptide (TPR) repeat protein
MGSRWRLITTSLVLVGFGSTVLWIGYHLYGTLLTARREVQQEGYMGSAACRPCHEEFYRLWESSHHGRAMQPFSAELAGLISPQSEDVVIGERRYRAVLSGAEGWVVEYGASGEVRYRIEYALGGKNVYYFLTALDRGRLQTLPVAYDVSRREWFDTSASALRHFNEVSEKPVFWREFPYTFNSACYGCHVSQMSTNYDPRTDRYATVWTEPGINCETCHGPGEEHVRAAVAASPESRLPDAKIIRIRSDLTIEQRNDACASCHAKINAITSGYRPGDRFYDHFDLITLESADFYPDGRDLGENYTETQWSMNPCAKSGQLDCIHCHTSSGRYRFAEEEHANDACMPCHEARVRNAAEHTHHPENTPGSRCISCHMPKTEFARMRRSDHSFRPPAPAATVAFRSPNACNLCHEGEDARWSDRWVRRWHKEDYQSGVLRRGQLIAEARRQDWSWLPEMLDMITGPDRDEVFANSMIRLLRGCADPRKWPALMAALRDPSPLIRGSAVQALGDDPRPEHLAAIAAAASDDYKLVRVRAGAALSSVPEELLPPELRAQVRQTIREYLDSIAARADDYAALYNLGNYYMERGDPEQAVAFFEKSLSFDPRFVPALVNSALAYNEMKRNQEALQNLQRAAQEEPESVPVQLNLGLLLAEMGRKQEAKEAFRKVLVVDPQSAPAAHNLGILLAGENLQEAVALLRRAFESRPGGKYGYTLAFYLSQSGDVAGAIRILRAAIDREPAFPDTYRLLADLYASQGRTAEAAAALQALQKLEKK